MPAKLPDSIRTIAIQQWLQGVPRNEIGAKNGLSSGSVTNIINEWRQDLGFALADELREIAVAMKKVGITAAQCALGFRAAMIMNNIGVKEDDIEYFISDIYNKCKDIGLSAENIAIYLQDLLEFSKTAAMPILPISKIDDYLKRKTEQKIELQEQIKALRQQIQQLDDERFSIHKLRDEALQEQKMTASDLQWYSDLRSQLGSQYGIPVEDLAKFSKVVDGIRKHGYDVGKVVNEFSNLEMLVLKQKNLQQNLKNLEARIANLSQQCSITEVKVNFHNEAISKYTQLESIGFGLKELTLLWNIVNEIAEANNIPIENVTSKFITDIEDDYDKKLGFESKLEKLHAEIVKVSQELTLRRTELSTLQLVGPALSKLIQSGLKEQDIINVAYIFERYFIGIDKQSLISELERYGGIRSAIQKAGEENDKMNNEITSLRKEKQDLEIYNQSMSSGLVYLNHKTFFLQGYVNSLRNEILGLSLISRIISHFLKSQIDDLQRSRFYYYNIHDFLPLIRAHNGDMNIPINQIRIGVIKAIEILLDRIKSSNNDNNSKLIEILTSARGILIDGNHN
jgi:uncharacterized coiled-coil DUF342 family protein